MSFKLSFFFNEEKSKRRTSSLLSKVVAGDNDAGTVVTSGGGSDIDGHANASWLEVDEVDVQVAETVGSSGQRSAAELSLGIAGKGGGQSGRAVSLGHHDGNWRVGQHLVGESRAGQAWDDQEEVAYGTGEVGGDYLGLKVHNLAGLLVRAARNGKYSCTGGGSTLDGGGERAGLRNTFNLAVVGSFGGHVIYRQYFFRNFFGLTRFQSPLVIEIIWSFL